MTLSRGPALPLILMLIVLAAAGQVTRWWAGDAALETDVVELVPTGDMNARARQLYDTLLARAGQRVAVVVEGETVDAVESAAMALEEALRSMPAVSRVDARPDPGALAATAAFFTPHRDALLSRADRAALRDDPAGAMARWLGEPTFFRPLPPAQDPLGTLGRFLGDALGTAREVDSDGFFYWTARDPGQAPAAAMFATVRAQSLGSDAADILVDDLQARFETVEAAHSVDISAAGALFHASAAKRRAQWETGVFGGAGMVMVSALLAFAFFSLAPLFKAVGAVGVALLAGFAAASAVYPTLHVLTLVMAVPVIGVAVDYLVHAEVHRRSRQAVGTQRAGALPRRLVRALSWGCLSSVLGYAAIAVVDIAVLRQVSMVLAAGLVAALLWVIVLARRPVAESRNARVDRLARSALMRRLGAGVGIRLPLLLLLPLTLLALAALAPAAGWVTTNNSPGALHRPAPSVAADDARVAARLGPSSSRAALVVEGRDVEQMLQRAEALAASLNDELGVQASTLSELVPSAARQRDNRQLMRRGFDTLSAAQRQNITLAPPMSVPLERVLRPGQLPEALVSTLPPFDVDGGDGAWAALSLHDDVDAGVLASWCAAQSGCAVVDSVASMSAALGGTHAALRWGLAAALAGVSLILLIRYRGRGLLAAMLLATGIAAALLVPGLAGMPITLLATCGMFVLLGLSVDYVIFVLEAPARREHTWLAICLSAATTLATFGLLLASVTPAVRMLAAPVVAGLPVMVGALFLFQRHLSRFASGLSTTPQPETRP